MDDTPRKRLVRRQPEAARLFDADHVRAIRQLANNLAHAYARAGVMTEPKGDRA